MMWSAILAGRSWRLWLDRPVDAAPDAALPVIWVLDGAETFDLVAATVQRLARRPGTTGVPPCIVVGVDRDPPDREVRWFDATAEASSDPDHALKPHGGAEALLDLVHGVFLDALLETGPIDRTCQVLVGHSLMGWMTLYAAAARPKDFQAFVSVSPSIWWNPEAMTARLATLPNVGQRVFVAVGEREEPPVSTTPEDARRAARQMIGNARTAGERLEARLGFDRVRTHIAPGEDHASVLPAVLPRALRFAFENRL